MLHAHGSEAPIQGFLAIPAQGPVGVGDGILIGLPRRALGGGDGRQLEPGMIRQGGQKLLARHTGCTYHGDFLMTHCLPLCIPLIKN